MTINVTEKEKIFEELDILLLVAHIKSKNILSAYNFTNNRNDISLINIINNKII